MDYKLNMTDNADHAHTCHLRWAERMNRSSDDPAYTDDWVDEQCGGCCFFITLSGALGSDYGACTNPASPFDGRVMFEHDGCEAFEWAANPWGNTSEETDMLRSRPPEDFKRLAIDALRDNTQLARMTPEQRELAAEAFETIGVYARSINLAMLKLLNQDRVRFFREKLGYIAATQQEYGKYRGQTTNQYHEGDRVHLKHNSSLSGLQPRAEGIVRLCYDVTPLAYEVTFTDEAGKPFDALMYEEELE